MIALNLHIHMLSLNCKGRLLFVDHPIVMGIINITPDSFYAGSRIGSEDALIRLAEKMLKDGATILDIGGVSTRPGASDVSIDEELNRVVPAVEIISEKFPDAFISVDSFRSEVARAALDAGASIINDIGAGDFEALIRLSVSRKAPYICMHSRGNPGTMQLLTKYDDIVSELLDYFIKRKSLCRELGLKDLIVDPGFGFAKNIQQNFKLLKNLNLFSMLELPVLVGLSRKSTIYKTLDTSAAESLNGSTVMHTLALEQGAKILRTHDVKETVEAIRLWMSYTYA
jgi:dihydropteroate synthase